MSSLYYTQTSFASTEGELGMIAGVLKLVVFAEFAVIAA